MALKGCVPLDVNAHGRGIGKQRNGEKNESMITSDKGKGKKQGSGKRKGKGTGEMMKRNTKRMNSKRGGAALSSKKSRGHATPEGPGEVVDGNDSGESSLLPGRRSRRLRSVAV